MPKKLNSLMKNVRRMMLLQNSANFGLVQDMSWNRSYVMPLSYFDDGDDDSDDGFEDE